MKCDKKGSRKDAKTQSIQFISIRDGMYVYVCFENAAIS